MVRTNLLKECWAGQHVFRPDMARDFRVLLAQAWLWPSAGRVVRVARAGAAWVAVAITRVLEPIGATHIRDLSVFTLFFSSVDIAGDVTPAPPSACPLPETAEDCTACVAVETPT